MRSLVRTVRVELQARVRAKVEVHENIDLLGLLRVDDGAIHRDVTHLRRDLAFVVGLEALDPVAVRVDELAFLVEVHGAVTREADPVLALDGEEAVTRDREVRRRVRLDDRTLSEQRIDRGETSAATDLVTAEQAFQRLRDHVLELRTGHFEAGGAGVGDVVAVDGKGFALTLKTGDTGIER